MTELLHFTADWCQPCKKLAPIIETFINDNPNIVYTKIDIEEDFDTAKANNVMSIPTLIAFKDNKVIGRHTGMADYPTIESLFE